jgi:hypothetical protein
MKSTDENVFADLFKNTFEITEGLKLVIVNGCNF